MSPAPNETAAALSETVSMPKPLAAGRPSDEAKNWELSNAKLTPPPPDPLDAIMMLSEEERIALFT